MPLDRWRQRQPIPPGATSCRGRPATRRPGQYSPIADLGGSNFKCRDCTTNRRLASFGQNKIKSTQKFIHTDQAATDQIVSTSTSAIWGPWRRLLAPVSGSSNSSIHVTRESVGGGRKIREQKRAWVPLPWFRHVCTRVSVHVHACAKRWRFAERVRGHQTPQSTREGCACCHGFILLVSRKLLPTQLLCPDNMGAPLTHYYHQAEGLSQQLCLMHFGAPLTTHRSEPSRPPLPPLPAWLPWLQPWLQTVLDCGEGKAVNRQQTCSH